MKVSSFLSDIIEKRILSDEISNSENYTNAVNEKRDIDVI